LLTAVFSDANENIPAAMTKPKKQQNLLVPFFAFGVACRMD
jgi:hypothetical protein